MDCCAFLAYFKNDWESSLCRSPTYRDLIKALSIVFVSFLSYNKEFTYIPLRKVMNEIKHGKPPIDGSSIDLTRAQVDLHFVSILELRQFTRFIYKF